MAVYRRVDDVQYSHPRADCLYIGISSGPNNWYPVWEAFTFLLVTNTNLPPVLHLFRNIAFDKSKVAIFG